MTQERDFDRIAEAWLAEAPNEAPDRAVAAVLAAIETTSQVRRPPRWPAWRQIHMSPRTFAIVGTLMLAVVVASSLLLTDRSKIAAPTTPPSIAPAGFLPALVGQWAGAPNTLSGIAQGAIIRSYFNQNGRWDISGDTIPIGLTSNAAILGSDRLTLTATRSTKTCDEGDLGTYRYALSPGQRRLKLTADSDACAARRIAVEGDWVRNDCKTGPGVAGGDFDCYGDLEAGTYKSRGVDLRFEIVDREPPIIYGALTFTVPDGWSHVADNATRFWLMPSTEYSRLHEGVPLDGLFVFGHPQASSQDDDCPYAAEKGVGLTPAALMASLTSRSSLNMSTPQEITINGRSGLWSDIQLDPSWRKSCQWSDGAPAAPILYANTGLSGVDATTRERLILLDIGHRDAVSIEIQSVDPSTWDTFVADAMSVVESFEFAEPQPEPSPSN
jgi:hypothetical protein